MKRLGLVALVLLMLTPSLPAFAATERTASCLIASHLRFSPGVTLTTQRVSSTTNGETGSIICVGTVKGHEVTGPGTVGFQGFFDMNCLGGTGSETLSATIPTSGGPQSLSFTVNETVYPGAGYKSGGALVGIAPFVFYPSSGDCVTGPVTEVFFTATAVVMS